MCGVRTGHAGHSTAGSVSSAAVSVEAGSLGRGERIVANASTPPAAQIIPAISAARWNPADSSAGSA